MQPLTDHCTRRPARRRPSAREGITLVELMVVLVLIGAVGATIGHTLVRQQRFYRGTSELLHAREGVRDAMELLSTDIRGMSVADTVRLLADSAIEFFANVGSSVVCQHVGTTAVGLPGVSSERGNVLTAFTTTPDTGDIAVFHKDSIDAGSEWEHHRISGFGPRSLAVTCPASTDLGRNADINAGTTGFLLELSTPLGGTVSVGAPVRFLRRGRYSLYHGSDGSWYLGYRRCNAVGAACGPIQPLSGPYRDYSSDPERTGLRFDYFDPSGRRLAANESPLGLARIDITARAESRQRLDVEGRVSIPSDSATIAIAIRNRAP